LIGTTVSGMRKEVGRKNHFGQTIDGHIGC
jgi:hypothetical protein